MRTAKLLFIGGGNMARCIISGLVDDGYDTNAIWVADPNANKRQYFEQTLQIHTTDAAETILNNVDIVILAIKPQSIDKVAKALGQKISDRQPLLISIAAGITTDNLQTWFGAKTPIIRAMPNTPALVQAGASTLFATEQTSNQQCELAEHILRAVGMVVWVDTEELIDVSTTIAGSSPGYIYLIMEAMQAKAVSLGLDTKTAKLLIIQSLFGTAKLALESSQDFEQLRQQVTSKAGVTEAAINSLKADHIDQIFDKAIHAAHNRCAELSQQFGPQKQLTD